MKGGKATTAIPREKRKTSIPPYYYKNREGNLYLEEQLPVGRNCSGSLKSEKGR